MLWMFRKKSPTQKALGWLQRQCRDAQPADLIGVIIIAGAAWVYSRGTDKNDPHGSDNDKAER